MGGASHVPAGRGPFAARGGVSSLHHPGAPSRTPALPLLRRLSATVVVFVISLSLCPVAFYWGVLFRAEVAQSLLSPAQVAGALVQLGEAVVQPQQPVAGTPGAQAVSLVPARYTAGQLQGLDEVLARVAGPDKKLIWGSASSDYLDFLVNWYLSVDRVGYGHKVLFVAEDEVALNFLLERWPERTLTGEQLLESLGQTWRGPGDNATEAPETPENRQFNSSYYNALVDRRPEYFKLFLMRNITFLYNDVDIVWLGDPFPFFQGDFDLWVQEDAGALPAGHTGSVSRHLPVEPAGGFEPHLCTCFMMVRPTEGSRGLIHKWSYILRMRVRDASEPIPNQPAFNHAYYNLTRVGRAKLGALPRGHFPSGCLYFRRNENVRCMVAHERYWSAVDVARTFPIIAHNNWIKGHRKKLAAFRGTNLWLLWHLRGQEREMSLSTIPLPENLTRLDNALYGGAVTRRLLRTAGALGGRRPG